MAQVFTAITINLIAIAVFNLSNLASLLQIPCVVFNSNYIYHIGIVIDKEEYAERKFFKICFSVFSIPEGIRKGIIGYV
jgi:hypothetical protein